MLANLNRTMSDKPGEMEKGLLVLGIVGAVGTWIYDKLYNTRQIFQIERINLKINLQTTQPHKSITVEEFSIGSYFSQIWLFFH